MTINVLILCVMLGFSLLITFLYGVTSYHSQKACLMKDIDRSLFMVATLAREMLPADYHDRITGPDSVSDSEFQSIVERNNRLCASLGLGYIWSLMAVDGKIVFTSATSPDQVACNRNHARFFEPHSNPEIYASALASMTTTYKSVHDKWGDNRIVLIPALDAHGRKHLFGASFRMAAISRDLGGIVWRSLEVGLVIFALSVLVGAWLTHVVTRPLRQLTTTIQEIAAGNSTLEAEERGTYEQATLAYHFNRMSQALRQKLAESESVRQRLIDTQTAERDQAKETLVQSEQRYEGLLNFAVDGIMIFSLKGIVLEANECLCAIFGAARDALLGKHVNELPFTQACKVQKPFRFDLLQKGETVVSERTILRPDGSEIIIEMHSKKMKGGTCQSILHDITERKRAEDELRQSQQELARQYEIVTALLHNLGVGVLMVEAPSGRPLAVNQAACQLLGRGVLADADRMSRDERYEAYKAGDRTRYPIEEMPITLGMKGISAHVDDLVVVRPDGTERLLEIFGAPIKDAQGAVWASLVSFSDITERKRTEQALRDSEDRYRLLFEMESDALFLIENEKGQILDVNQTATTLYGYTCEELRSMRNVDLSAEPEQTKQATTEATESQPALIRIALRRHRKRDGSVFPVEIMARTFMMNGRAVHIAAIRDITERQKTQELLVSWSSTLEQRVAERTAESEQRLQQLQRSTVQLIRAEENERKRIADVLHEDLQQTLVAARMMLSAAVEQANHPVATESFERVEEMILKSILLTRSLVQAIAVPSAKEGELPAAILWIEQQMQTKFGLKVTLTADEGVEPVSENVYLCLFRAVQEILFNVVKHAQVLQAEVVLQKLEGHVVRVTIRDKGNGFSGDRPPGASKSDLGVGLSGIRDRVEGLGGKMEIVSAKGVGTTVILTVPTHERTHPCA